MKKLIFISFLLVTIFAMGQRRYAADRYFKEYAYFKSAELYQKIYKSGDSSKLVLSRLATSYYNNNNTKSAEKWYSKLFKLHPIDSSNSEDLFRFSQVLKGNGKYKESDIILLKFRKLNKNDSRGHGIETTRKYYTDFIKKRNDSFYIYNLSVNTKFSDFGTFVNESKVIFASTGLDSIANGREKLYKWNNQPYLNLYQAKEKVFKSEDGLAYLNDLYEVEKLQGGINTRYHEANSVVTKDGKTMYFTRDNFDGKKLKGDSKNISHLKLFKAELVNNTWVNIKELPFNNENYSIGQPALSNDEKVLYFVSDMPGNYGYTDIYRVNILSNNVYGAVENLGKKINTSGREMFPFFGLNNQLYFSSDGHLGLGGLDIFKSKIKENSFLEVKNIGTPINSKSDDFSFVTNKEEMKGYFSSNREGGKGDDDIYSFTIIECKGVINGVITDYKTKKAITGAGVKLVNSRGKILNRVVTDSNGEYSFKNILCKEEVVVVAEKDNYRSSQQQLMTGNKNKSNIKADLPLLPLIIENQIVINPIFFDFNKFNIRPDAAYELEHIVTTMQHNEDMVIKIESHTDAIGTSQYNIKLSSTRAKATKDYLVSRGISSKRILSAIGYGESKLLNHCNNKNSSKCSKKEHQLNRRSYFYIVK